jgi:hypothetical protein
VALELETPGLARRAWIGLFSLTGISRTLQVCLDWSLKDSTPAGASENRHIREAASEDDLRCLQEQLPHRDRCFHARLVRTGNMQVSFSGNKHELKD